MRLIKINRLAAWILLVTILLYFISGYGMTKEIIDRQFSVMLHQDLLPPIAIIAFVIHASASIKYAFMRWRIWNALTKISLITLSTFICLLFLYIQFFYQSTNFKTANNTSNLKLDNGQRVQKTFTSLELSKYNGKDGNPAYVAVDGVVYDLSSVFVDGVHFGHTAGQDLTDAFFIKHVKSQITKYPIIGLLK